MYPHHFHLRAEIVANVLTLIRKFPQRHFSSCLVTTGVREGGHLPAGQAADGGSQGARRLLRDSLRGCVREDRHEVTNFRDSPAGGTVVWKLAAMIKLTRYVFTLFLPVVPCLASKMF